MIQLSDGFFMNVDSRNYTIGIPKKQIVENKETGEPQETIIMTDAKYYPTLNAALVGWWEAVRTKKLSEFNGSLEEALRLVKEQDKEIRSLIDNFNIIVNSKEPVEVKDDSGADAKPEPRRRGRPRKVQG